MNKKKYDSSTWKTLERIKIPLCDKCKSPIVLHHISNFEREGQECLGAHFVCTNPECDFKPRRYQLMQGYKHGRMDFYTTGTGELIAEISNNE